MKRILLFVVLSAVLLSLWGCNEKQAARPFITKWKGKAGQELKIPILGTYTLTWYNEATPNERHTQQVTVLSEKFNVNDWHEIEEITPFTLTIPTDGIYVVEAGPDGVEGMSRRFDDETDYDDYAEDLLLVVQFGDVVWKRLDNAFLWSANMQFDKDIDTPNLSQCTTMSGMFNGCTKFNLPLEHWDVSAVTDMSNMFEYCMAFNQPLEKWDVSQVTDMQGMFGECRAFNQPLAQWNVSAVTNMKDMFRECSSFNQPLERWDVSAVTDMRGMFSNCSSFNQPLERWNVAKVTTMRFMFEGCTSFKQSLEAWEIDPIAHAEGMQGMFNGTPAARLPFVAKWRAAGYQLGISDEEQIPDMVEANEEKIEEE